MTAKIINLDAWRRGVREAEQAPSRKPKKPVTLPRGVTLVLNDDGTCSLKTTKEYRRWRTGMRK